MSLSLDYRLSITEAELTTNRLYGLAKKDKSLYDFSDKPTARTTRIMRHRGKTYWRKRRDRLLKKHLVVEGKALDIGCGWRRYGKDAVRLDLDPKCQPDILADIQGATGLPDASFDTILALDVLEHLRYPHRAVAEMERILKPGGVLYITVPFCFPRHGKEYYRFSDLALQDMLSGFDTEIIPVKKSKFWNFVWNYYQQDPIVEGYFVKARKKESPEEPPL